MHTNRHGFHRGTMLLFLCLSAFICGSLLPPTSAYAADDKPNLLVILADDLGYGDLSAYGAEDLRTPAIDSLADAGMRFNNAYANCPVCSPTRAALLTGKYPALAGVPGVIRTHADNSWGYFDPATPTLPNLLKQAGYHTAIVGKWHLGLRPENHPNRRGFDLFHGFLGDMMDDYHNHRRHDINYMRRNTETIDPEGHATDLFTQWAIDYINDRAGRTDQNKPFFLYLAYNAPHTPIQPPDAWLEKVKQREPTISDQRAKLVALIEHMDHGVGRVIAALKAAGEYENTLILFTSDNGGLLRVGATNGPLRGGKGGMYEGGIRVPMAAAWHGRIPPGSRTDRVTLTMDIFPTLCDAAGAPITHPIDGRSFLPTLRGQNQPPETRDLFWIRREGGNRYMGQPIWAARRGHWKLLQNTPTQPFELYNLKDDPKEQNDLSQKNREKYNELAAALRAHLQRGGSIPWQKPE